MPAAPPSAAGGHGREVAERSDIIITMVPDTPDVAAVLFGENGVAEGLSAGQDRRRHELHLANRDQGLRRADSTGSAARYLDAPVSGGEVGAKAGKLTIMVGGSQATFDTVKPLFDLMGANITLVGGNGDGQTTKVANQIIVALTDRGGRRGAAVRVEGGRRSRQGAAGAHGRIRLVEDP